MLSVKDCSKELIIKKSKFISYLFKVDSINNIDDHLSFLKQKYKDATHICYAYILENKKKCSDDGEPSKTAGMPILNILENNNLDHVLCVVIRYFGGIKLGANGLIRAYSNICKETLINNIIELDSGIKLQIIFSYDKTKIIDNLLKDIFIYNKEYDSNVKYEFELNYDKYYSIKDELLKNTILSNDLGNCYIEKIK